jgi:hypothetical protein
MDRELSNDDLRAIELLHQLQALSPEDAETAVRMTLRMPNGHLVGEALLSAKAVEALTDDTISLNAYLADQDPALCPADPLPYDDEDIAESVTALEDLANGEL